MGESVTQWAWYQGQYDTDDAWLLHPCDVWVRNPHYLGDPRPHPEDDADQVLTAEEQAAIDNYLWTKFADLWAAISDAADPNRINF